MTFSSKVVGVPSQPDILGYFRVQLMCFARIGINPTSLDATFFNLWLVWLPMLTTLSLCICMLTFAVENISDLNKVTDALSPFWQGVLSIAKLIFILRKRQKYVILIRKLWLWNVEAKGQELKILAEENHKDIIFCKYYHITVLSTGIAAVVSPLLIAGYHFVAEGLFWSYLEPPLKASYFFINLNTLIGYIICIIWNCIAVYNIIYGSLSTDCLFSWFVCNIVAQFRILKYRLHVAGLEHDGNCSMETLRACIKYHNRCIQLAAEFNDVFASVVFLKFTISCIQICCLAFQFTRSGEFAQQLFQGMFLLSVSMQMILYCYGGQRVQDVSTSIATEIYESFHWESLTMTNKKMLILPILRAQRACHVSGIFFTADLSLFLWVYRTAASFITLLWTLDEKEDVEVAE